MAWAGFTRWANGAPPWASRRASCVLRRVLRREVLASESFASCAVWPVVLVLALIFAMAMAFCSTSPIVLASRDATPHLEQHTFEFRESNAAMATLAFDDAASKSDESHWAWLAGGVGLLGGLGVLAGWVASVGRWRGATDVRIDRIEKDDATRDQSLKEMREAIADMLREERVSREAMLREEREARVRGEERVAEELGGIRKSLDQFIQISMQGMAGGKK